MRMEDEGPDDCVGRPEDFVVVTRKRKTKTKDENKRRMKWLQPRRAPFIGSRIMSWPSTIVAMATRRMADNEFARLRQDFGFSLHSA